VVSLIAPTEVASRAGSYVPQPAGYEAFVPAELPPEPPVDLARLAPLLSSADQAIGRLDGIGRTIPDPDLFLMMYVRREAVLSSQIEGTQSTLEDVLAYEAGADVPRLPRDVPEVVNHVHAMNYGLARMETLPLSLRLIREIHARLLQGARGQERTPGEFRTSQNWIGAEGSALSQATFVPPPSDELPRLLGNLEAFLHQPAGLPALVEAGVAHAQFETIHPFHDGNGRVGRLLITLLLVRREVLHRPLLYLSHHLKRNRAEYYDRLTAVRERGDWEGWLAFFLRGVAETAAEGARTVGEILALREAHRGLVGDLGVNGLRVLDHLYRHPVVTANSVQAGLNVSWPTANKLVTQLQARGLLEEITGHRRNRVYRYGAYVDVFRDEG
jgi:Fic family protein